MGSGDIGIRQCTTGDFHAVFGLLEQLWPDLELRFEVLSEVFSRYVDDDVDVPVCAVADGQIVGFASLNVRNSLWRSGKIAYLDVLVVDEGHKRQGIGAMLVERSSAIALERGCSYLELDSAFHRAGAHDFYESQGFQRFGIMFGKRL